MYCIKQKCKYCDEDDFKENYYRCMLNCKLFKRDAKMKCIIDEEIADTKIMLETLQEVRNHILEVNNKGDINYGRNRLYI